MTTSRTWRIQAMHSLPFLSTMPGVAKEKEEYDD